MLEDAQTVTNYDVAVIIIIALSSVFALLRGFLKEILVLTGWIGATAVTFYAFPHAIEFLNDFMKSSKIVNVIAIGLVFLAVLTLISIINAMILDNLREMRLGIIDRSLGLLFGLVRGVLFASIVHFAILILHEDDEGPEWLSTSETFKITAYGAGIIQDLAKDFTPEQFREAAEDLAEDAREVSEDIKTEDLDDIESDDFFKEDEE